MAKQLFNRVVMPAQLFLIGHELVDRRMAIATKGNGLLHFDAFVPFAKPLVPVAFAGNQVMSRRSLFCDSPAEFAGGRCCLHKSALM